MYKEQTAEDFAENQLIILEKLLEKSYMQKDLAKELGISGAGLLYHINKLEEETQLITRKTTVEVGSVKLKEISLNPNAIQKVRNILGHKTDGFTLISGMGKDYPETEYFSHRLPAKAKTLLEEMGYKIHRVVTFITDESKIDKAREIINIDKVFKAKYNDYRNLDSDLMKKIETELQQEMKQNDLILDLTPLSKLLSIKLLEFSYKYQVPSFYLGQREKEGETENFIIWINHGNSSKN